MAKASSFWIKLCEELDYRFFTGIPFKEADSIYKGMSSDIMHYIPAAHEEIAVKLAVGAWISGFKSCIILESRKILSLDLNFPNRLEIPLIFISDNLPKTKDFNVADDVDKLLVLMEKNKLPGILTVG